jgi:hypothetical protein
MRIVCKPVNSRPVAESSTAADSGIYFFAPLEYLALSENTFIGQPDKLFSAGPAGSRISTAKTGLGSRLAAELAEP